MSTSDPTPVPSPRLARRALLRWSGAAGLAGLAAGGAGGAASAALGRHDGARAAPLTDELTAARLAPVGDLVADRSLPMGLGERIPAFGRLLAFDLDADTLRSASQARGTTIAFLRFLARLADQAATISSYPRVSDAIDPRTTGAAGLDLRPASLQVTPGVGASLLTACDLTHRRPAQLVDLPAFATDRLDEARCGGDLMVQIGAEDPLKLAGTAQAVMSYARHQLDGRWRLRWSRSGFRGTAVAAENPATTGRNLMGHRDGTDNPTLGTPLWRTTVQSRLEGWMQGGSYLVARQILIDLDTWFGHDEASRDRVIGRQTGDGAALGAHTESQLVDLGARDADGALAIPAHAHIRLASPQNTLGARIYRRSWNFDDGYDGEQRTAGLLFLAWQADIRRGFLPIQRALVRHHDALSTFTTHIGSAVFAVPTRGDDEYVGQRLLEA